jgi:2-oxoglutarate-Fe(II)-dependent oxygenase superfamily protein
VLYRLDRAFGGKDRRLQRENKKMKRTGPRNIDLLAAQTAPVMVVDGFLPLELAREMRRDIEAHFADPEGHNAEIHQVWNYWFVPDMYTYLRTAPEKVVDRDRIEAFHNALCDWSIAMLGMPKVTWPYLSLYVSGCRQGWHNDTRNGRFAFVYSLTRNERQTIGGETMVQRDVDPFRAYLTRAAAGHSFYDTIEPKFNRLIVFDDRLPHAVERIDGSMDPTEGRFVLHGHLSEGGTIIEGPLPVKSVAGPLMELLRQFKDEYSAEAALYNGPLVFRLTVDADGAVAGCEVIVDRVIHLDRGHVGWPALRAKMQARFKDLRFPPAAAGSVVVQPVLFVGSS